MNTSQLKRYIRKMRITNQSIVLIKKISEDGTNESNLAREFAEAVKASGLHDIFIVVLEDFDSIATYDIREMNKMGWFRREQILSLFKKMTSDRKPEERTEDDKSGVV